jgi:hypothetical protein
MPSINPERLLGDLYELRKIGAYKTGVHRPTLSAEDVQSRTWLVERMERAGLEPVIDGIANVVGFSRASGRKMLAGSHIETQNHAGWLDGALGVIYALEAARAFADDPSCAGLGIDVVAFADEEGHFGNFMGSRSFVGVLSEEDIDKARDRTNGTPLRDALAKAGYAGRPRLQIDPSRYAGYFEAHIEQARCASASSPPSSRYASTVSASPASRTTRAPPRWRAGATPGSRWCGCLPRSTGAFPKSRASAACGPRGASRCSPVTPASCPAAPRPCFSSATPIRRCSTACMRHSST